MASELDRDPGQPGALVSLSLLAAVAGVLILRALEHLGVPASWLDVGYWLLGLGGAAAAAILLRTSVRAPAFRGLALAADSIGAAFFLGLAGAVFAWGQDGLAFGLGLGAGYLLLQLLIAPRLPLAGCASVPEYFSKRYGGALPRTLGALAVAISMLVLLAAQLSAGGLLTARLLASDLGTGTAVAAVALWICFAVSRGGKASSSGVLFPAMLVAFLMPAVVLSAQRYGVPVPQIAYANALWQVQGLEETLLEQDLADPALMKPMLGPFLSLNALNVLGLILGLAAGMACLPHVLARYFSAPLSEARWSAVWALAFAALFLTGVPAVAVYAKLAVLSLIGAHTSTAELPAWVFDYGRLGLVDICGAPATGAAAVAAACAALPDWTGALRLQDLAVQSDIVALAAPEITGFGEAAFGFLAAAALAAALLTSLGPLAAVVRAFGTDLPARSGAHAESEPTPPTALAIAAGAVAAAALGAAARPGGMLTLATWALSLAAAGLFPALVAGLWWRRANAAGAGAAIGAGIAVCLIYLVATRYFAVDLFQAWPSLSSAGMTARETFEELRQAWMAAAPGAARDAAWSALDQHAQTIANLWGIKPLAVVLLALPVGVMALVAASLATPRDDAS